MEKLAVINDARAPQAAESHAEAERFRCERLSDQVQSIKGNVRVFARVRRLPHTSFTFDGSGPAPSPRDRTDLPHLRISKIEDQRSESFGARQCCPALPLCQPRPHAAGRARTRRRTRCRSWTPTRRRA
jgi:hypothetical protein